MSDFELWTRGDLANESSRQRMPRSREPWQAKHDSLFRQVWGEQSSRAFRQKQRDPLPTLKPTRRKPGHRMGLVLGLVFIAGVIVGFLAKQSITL